MAVELVLNAAALAYGCMRIASEGVGDLPLMLSMLWVVHNMLPLLLLLQLAALGSGAALVVMCAIARASMHATELGVLVLIWVLQVISPNQASVEVLHVPLVSCLVSRTTLPLPCT
jgi:hypothetical protein